MKIEFDWIDTHFAWSHHKYRFLRIQKKPPLDYQKTKQNKTKQKQKQNLCFMLSFATLQLHALLEMTTFNVDYCINTVLSKQLTIYIDSL